MSTKVSSTGALGAAVYTPLLLKHYEPWVLGFSNSCAWLCSSKEVQLPFFTAFRSSKHLDVGVGTGYYPANAPAPQDSTITLADLNANSLSVASAHVRKAHPHTRVDTVQLDLLDVPHMAGTAGSFIAEARAKGLYDSISALFLLNCVPGAAARKTAALAMLAAAVLKPHTGVLFGSTVLGSGVWHHVLGRALMRIYNRIGLFNNWEDSADAIVGALREWFDEVEWRVVGVVLFFVARRPLKV